MQKTSAASDEKSRSDCGKKLPKLTQKAMDKEGKMTDDAEFNTTKK